jgi:hypothetical protein
MLRKCPSCDYKVTAETQASLEAAGSDLCLNCGEAFPKKENLGDRYLEREVERFFASGLTFRTGKFWMAAVLAAILLALKIAENC